MDMFLNKWGEAANTTAGFFWMATWAFILGYLVSSMIQVFVTEKRMQHTMGNDQSGGILIGTFFGFISSSCSFAALATTKTLFKKGAGFAASMAFLLASTNLVIELGIIISIFLGWQFVVGEYLGGVLLILFGYLIIRVTNPQGLIRQARKKLEGQQEDSGAGSESWKKKLVSETSWAKVARQYGMEWKMVWKDVTVGFTIAGIVAVFVPDSFFQGLFIHTGGGNTDFSFLEILEHIMVGPVVAFLTFIGSMGNIPLAALLFGKGVSFAGVMAFIFSDLVVFPVLRINAKYYGWKMALYILILLLVSLVGSALALHYGFRFLQLLPDPSSTTIMDTDYFKLNYTFYMNAAFLILSGYLVYLGFFKRKDITFKKEMAPKGNLLEAVLKYLALGCYLWVVGGLFIKYLMH